MLTMIGLKLMKENIKWQPSFGLIGIQDFNKQSLLMLINRVTIAVFSIRHLTLVGWLVDLIVSASISIGIVVVIHS